MDIYTKDEIMAHYVVANLLRLQQILKPYKEQREALLTKEQGIWHLDINRQYNATIKSVIVADMCLNLPITTLDALVFIEDVDITQI